jgi:hypothetical protein
MLDAIGHESRPRGCNGAGAAEEWGRISHYDRNEGASPKDLLAVFANFFGGPFGFGVFRNHSGPILRDRRPTRDQFITPDCILE